MSDHNSDAEDNEINLLPSREECESRSQMFVDVTGTDSAMAMFYLQDREWNVERAVSDFFASQEADGASTLQQPVDVKSNRKRFNETHTLNDASLSKKILLDSRDGQSLTLSPAVLQPEQSNIIRILSWNIDGLDPDNLQSRTEGACSVLLQENADVIFLQEVVHRSLKIVKAKLEHKYTLITGNLDPVNSPGAYFTSMLLKKNTVVTETARVLDYSGSLMSRDLLQVQCKVRDIPFVLLNSHLESTKDYSDERRNQLKMAFKTMMDSDPDRTVVFGGDLNLRDKEVTGTSAKPDNIFDLWEITGKRPEAKFTWDLMINDNKQLGGKFQPRCRFDRMYIRHSNNHRDMGKTTSKTSVSHCEQSSSKFHSIFNTKGGKQSDSSNPGSVNNNNAAKSQPNTKSSTSSTSSHGEGSNSASILKPVYFELVGIQRLSSCRRFPSDHWGILAHLEIQ